MVRASDRRFCLRERIRTSRRCVGRIDRDVEISCPTPHERDVASHGARRLHVRTTAVRGLTVLLAAVRAWRAEQARAARRRARRDLRETLLEDAGGRRDELAYATALVDRVCELEPALADQLEDMLDAYVRTAVAIARSRVLISALDRAPRARSRGTYATYLHERAALLRCEAEARLVQLRDTQLATVELLQYAVERSAHRALVMDLALPARRCVSRTTRSSETRTPSRSLD